MIFLNNLNYSRIMFYGIIIVSFFLLVNILFIITQSKSLTSLTGLVSENIRIINNTKDPLSEQVLYSENSYIMYYLITTLISILIITIIIIISIPKLKKYT